jgi:predicted RNA-binding Zn-ribbon protein involved in translation (DUF1610 family)
MPEAYEWICPNCGEYKKVIALYPPTCDNCGTTMERSR